MARKKKSEKIIEEFMESLSSALLERLKEFRDGDVKYCIVDRFNEYNFFEIFKDSLYSYKFNTVLCERLFYEKKCYLTQRKILDLSENSLKLYESFIKFSEKLNKEDIKDLTKEDIEKRELKIKEYREKLEECPPKEKSIDVLSYKTDFNGEGYPVINLAEIDDNALTQISRIITNFVYSYFSTLKYIRNNGFSISLTPIFYEDYIDLVAIIQEG